MPLPSSLLAYEAELEVFDRALESPRGCRVQFQTFAGASKYRLRLNYARSLDRGRNKELFDEGHPLWGRSRYDKLSCKIRRDDTAFWVYITQNSGPEIIEDVSEDDTLLIEDATFVEIPKPQPLPSPSVPLLPIVRRT